MKIVLIHQHCPISGKNGGIETFIQDLISFKPENLELSIITATHMHSMHTRTDNCFPMAKQIWIPDTVRTAITLIVHANSFRGYKLRVIVNRFEYILIVKLIFPKSSVTFFKHTIGRTNESRASDSLWRYTPKIYRFFQWFALRLADQVWTSDKTEIENSKRINWMPMRATTDLQIFSNSLEKSLDLVWIGRLEEPKNPALAGRILSIFHKYGSSTLLIGEGSQNLALNEYRNSGGDIKSFLPKVEIAKVLAKSKVLLMTSHFEAAPRVMVEALSSGCFIACTPMSDPNGLIKIFPTRIAYFESEEHAFRIITSMLKKKFDEIDLSNFTNEKQFTEIWQNLMRGNHK